MSDTRYSVIYRGKILEGFNFETAKLNLMMAFSLGAENAEKILKSPGMTLKKDLEKSEALKLEQSLRQAGLDVALSEIPPEAAAPPAEPPAGETSTPAPAPSVPAAPSAPTTSSTASVPFEFHGTGWEYFKIWLVNVILSIITLGIYSPWAKVRRKQYLYGSTRLKGASFEYLADPKKILKGRAIVVAVLIVTQVVSELIPVAAILFSLAIVAVMPWVIVRSLAFNARNSAMRNIPFAFNGTAGEAAKVYILWPILGMFTLGLLSPYAFFKQKKYVVENSGYGTTEFSFDATARDYYGIFLGLLIPLVLGLVAVYVSSTVIPPASILFMLVLYLYLFAYVSVKTSNLLYNSSRLGAHRLKSTMKPGEFLGIVVVNSIAVALTLGLFHPWARIRSLRYKLRNLTLRASGDLDSFVAGEQKEVSALGEEMGDFLDFDFGL